MKKKYLEKALELKKNTEIIENTFNKYNLKVLQYSYTDGGIKYDDCIFYIEISSLEDTTLTEDVKIKLNLYDENGEIVSSKDELILAEKFEGYDTINIKINFCRALSRSKTARVFLIKK